MRSSSEVVETNDLSYKLLFSAYLAQAKSLGNLGGALGSNFAQARSASLRPEGSLSHMRV